MEKIEVSIVRLFSELSDKVEIWLSDEGWMMYEILLESEESERQEVKVG